MLNSVIFGENLLNDMSKKNLDGTLKLLGKFVAHLTYSFLTIIFLFVYGLFIGSSFDLTLNKGLQAIALLILIIVASWGLGLIGAFFARNDHKAIGVITLIPMTTIIFIIITSLRTNFFNRFPQIIIDVIRVNPFTASAASIIELIVGEGWVVIFDPLSSSHYVFTLVLPIVIFISGLALYYNFLVPKQQIITEEKNRVEIEEKKGSFSEMWKSAIGTCIFLPMQFLSEAVVILIIFFLPLSIDWFLSRQYVLIFGSIIGILMIYLFVIRLSRMYQLEMEPLTRNESLRWTLVIFCLLWLFIPLSTIVLDIISSLFSVEGTIFATYELLPANDS
jgi:hypothetical protein